MPTYTTSEPVYTRLSERELLLRDRFEPGELAKIGALALSSLLLWALACYGIGKHQPLEYPTVIPERRAYDPLDAQLDALPDSTLPLPAPVDGLLTPDGATVPTPTTPPASPPTPGF